jgi:hypothetical protein
MTNKQNIYTHAIKKETYRVHINAALCMVHASTAKTKQKQKNKKKKPKKKNQINRGYLLFSISLPGLHL